MQNFDWNALVLFLFLLFVVILPSVQSIPMPYRGGNEGAPDRK